MSGQLKTYHDAKPAKKQHRYPCSDCPFARKALRGWLGSMTPEEWIQVVHGEGRIDCHTVSNQQCAGAAIYRANVCKSPRDPQLLVLPQNKVTVFSWMTEFLAHHKKLNSAEQPCHQGSAVEGRLLAQGRRRTHEKQAGAEEGAMPSKESLAQKIVALVNGFADGAGATGWQTMLSTRTDTPETYKDEVESVEELLDEAIREARLTEAEIWNETLKVQDLRVCDIFWSKTRLAQLREGKT